MNELRSLHPRNIILLEYFAYKFEGDVFNGEITFLIIILQISFYIKFSVANYKLKQA